MRKKTFLLGGIILLPILLSKIVSAHCPLCTIGVGAAAAGAAWLGVSKVVIGLLIGAFAMSMGMWFSRVIKKKYIPFQKPLIVILVFLTTLLPLLPIVTSIGPLYLPFMGEYGTTYAINYSLISGFFGGLITLGSPSLNKKIKQKRNGKSIPFQGILLTFTLLAVAVLIIQFFII